MAARNLLFGALFLLAGGFAAGRAFSQNEIDADSVNPTQTDESVADPALDTFDIPMPPTIFQSSAESIEAPQPSRPARPVTAMPAKYFLPAGKPKSDEAVESLREKFTKIAAERAAIMTAEELQTEITAIEKVLEEFSARQSLDRAVKVLESVVSEYPETEAGKDARRALELLQSKPAGTRHSL